VKSAIVIGLALAATAANAQQPLDDRPRSGAWRQDYTVTVTKLDGQAFPQPEIEEETVTDCYAESDLADFAAILFAGSEDDCVGSDFVMAGGELSLFVRCEFSPGMTFEGQVQGTYDQTRFAIATVLVTQGKDQSEVVGEVSATWVGTCEAPS